MADDGRFFDESDPEWAVSQLAERSASGGGMPSRRRLPWEFVVGALVTTGLVAGAFALGVTHDAAPPAARPSALAPVPKATERPDTNPPTRPFPSKVQQAPQVTLAPMPEPQPDPVTPAPQPSVAPVVVAREPAKHRSNQVGPNKPIKTPIDPDDR